MVSPPDRFLLYSDHSDLTRPQKRAALLVIQAGRCAICRKPAPTDADHDHDTGFLLGLLCHGCNNRARRFGYAWWPRDVIAYLAYPPALGLDWIWAHPDWWGPDDTTACIAAGMTVADYVIALPGEAERRRGTSRWDESKSVLAQPLTERAELDNDW
jgi:Recombination endonuclease VII